MISGIEVSLVGKANVRWEVHTDTSTSYVNENGDTVHCGTEDDITSTAYSNTEGYVNSKLQVIFFRFFSNKNTDVFYRC